MDPFSASASVFSVVSLALQLGDGINGLCEFLASITEAPQEIESIIAQLKFFAELLDDIQNNEKIIGPQPAIKQALERCEAPLRDLQQIADSLIPGFAASSKIKRKWAAISAVRAKDKIAKFQSNLQVAKLDLVLARTLSADRTHHHYYQSYQDSLLPVVQGLADLRGTLSCNAEVITSHNHEGPGFVNDVSSKLQNVISSWPVAGQQNSSDITAVDKGQSDSEILLRMHRSRVAVSRCTAITPMILGDIHYRSTSYRTSSKPIQASEKDESIYKEQLEVETSFSFVPSWWTLKLVSARGFKLDIVKLSTQGWQTNMHTFNVVPDDSPIFEFCRDGNLDAVRYLLGSRKASVNDMTVDGWTPLHFAANYAQTAICSVLLQEGASLGARTTTWSRTALDLVCGPGDIQDDGSLLMRQIPGPQRKQTIRELIRAGEDFADLVYVKHVCDLILFEIDNTNDISNSVSWWLVNDILPTINPAILDRNFWELCLIFVVSREPGHVLLPVILRHCDVSMARVGILWICTQEDGILLAGQQDRMEVFRMLVDLAGGVSFMQEDFGGKEITPLFNAMAHSYHFFNFRLALEKVGIDIREVVRFQIQTCPDGWTQERLLALSLDQTNMEKRFLYPGLAHCALCGNFLWHPDRSELAWKRRVSRFKKGMDLNAPLSEEEAEDQKTLEDAIVDYENGVCLRCHEKKKKKSR
ncbi:hypothetical protein L207DRAFT_585193 [Hyaloscypha variabilis F]|uniref:Uncharacterized protein n=1 Tax=Hyaloscypha variabilis (strain UAMH 11265 / GT02V1 / F) TaxID=1149755 RepID=A0A2J6RIE1_HYAVF|nr:hypothetical protein L207DRAFT_585193 [Hyaloscypha variabilis F]